MFWGTGAGGWRRLEQNTTNAAVLLTFSVDCHVTVTLSDVMITLCVMGQLLAVALLCGSL
jgi:hypothetical protein